MPKPTPSIEEVKNLEVMDAREAAVYLRSSTSTLAKLRMSGDGPRYVRQSTRKTLYRRAELDAWLSAKTFANTSAEAVA